MRKILCICLLAAGAMLVQAVAASAQTSVVLRATLNGGEETPTPVLSGAVATAEVAVDPTNQELAVQMRVFNIPTGTTASHIHIASRGVNGPVVIDFPIGRGVTGDFTLNFRVHDGPAFHARPEIGINTFADALQAIAAGQAYVNIHTTTFPGGEIRGQLSVADPNTPQFPAQ
jgi:CHRD domain